MHIISLGRHTYPFADSQALYTYPYLTHPVNPVSPPFVVSLSNPTDELKTDELKTAPLPPLDNPNTCPYNQNR